MTPEWFRANENAILESKPDRNGFEPSGLTIFTDGQGVAWLYLVSDNGKIARRQIGRSGTNGWECADFASSGRDADTQFEAVTVAGNKLMLGIEGDSDGNKKTLPRIRRFDPAEQRHSGRRCDPDGRGPGTIGGLTPSEWVLEDLPVGSNAGMEGLTFVPASFCPPTWRSLYYGGFFFVASQGDSATLYVYDLPKGAGQVHEVKPVKALKLPNPGKLELSDCYFSQETGFFYVLFDHKGRLDRLQELELDLMTGQFLERRSIQLQYAGCEAVAVYQTSLYLGLDQTEQQMKMNKDQMRKQKRDPSHNYVFEYPGYTPAR